MHLTYFISMASPSSVSRYVIGVKCSSPVFRRSKENSCLLLVSSLATRRALQSSSKNPSKASFTAFAAFSWRGIIILCVKTTLRSKKSVAKIQITITTAHLIRINYPLSSFNYRLSGTNVANFSEIYRMVSEQQLFKKRNLKTEFSNMENTNWHT